MTLKKNELNEKDIRKENADLSAEDLTGVSGGAGPAGVALAADSQDGMFGGSAKKKEIKKLAFEADVDSVNGNKMDPIKKKKDLQ